MIDNDLGRYLENITPTLTLSVRTAYPRELRIRDSSRQFEAFPKYHEYDNMFNNLTTYQRMHYGL
jgi:hypothetical protein